MLRLRIYTILLFVKLICIISAVAGAGLIQVAPHLTGVYAMAAAAGALLAMTAVLMLPESIKSGSSLAGLMVVPGFAFTALLGLIG
jgi:hypothetical protein